MARGQRKTILEKLNEELAGVQDNIAAYERSIATLKVRSKELTEQIQNEEIKGLHNLMLEKNISVNALKEIINGGMIEEEQQMA
jgi:hypothetical protein